MGGDSKCWTLSDAGLKDTRSVLCVARRDGVCIDVAEKQTANPKEGLAVGWLP